MSQTDEHGKIEYEPHDDPVAIENEYRIHVYESEEIVPDLIVTHSEGDERKRLWGFQGHRGLLVLATYTEHQHPPDYAEPFCRKWSILDDKFSPLTDAPETPEEVREIAVNWSRAPVADKTRN